MIQEERLESKATWYRGFLRLSFHGIDELSFITFFSFVIIHIEVKARRIKEVSNLQEIANVRIHKTLKKVGALPKYVTEEEGVDLCLWAILQEWYQNPKKQWKKKYRG